MGGSSKGNDMQTDRNLLFGVLAFQDEYIDLAQLAGGACGFQHLGF